MEKKYEELGRRVENIGEERNGREVCCSVRRERWKVEDRSMVTEWHSKPFPLTVEKGVAISGHRPAALLSMPSTPHDPQAAKEGRGKSP